MAQDTRAAATRPARDRSEDRVIVFRPIIRIALATEPGVGAEEATTQAIASWSSALSGADSTGRPAPAAWWGADLYEVAEVVSVELQGATWVTEPGD